jgi:LysM repeat protein
MRRAAMASLLLLAIPGCGRSGGGEAIEAASTTTTAAATTTTQAPDPPYVVQPGDSLSAIAERFGVSVDEIAAANGITDVDTITAGDTLVIPRGPSTTGPTTTSSTAGSEPGADAGSGGTTATGGATTTSAPS